MRRPSPVAAGTVLDGRFRLEVPFDRTAHTRRYRAADLATGQAVAVEVTETAVAEDFAEFLRGRFDGLRGRPPHPARIAVLGFGVDPATGAGWVATDLVIGPTLWGLAAGKRPGAAHGLEPRLAARLALQVLDACDGRSVPPPWDVRVELDAPGGPRVRLALARVDLGGYPGFTGRGAEAHGAHGAVAFLAPEQLDDASRADARSAVYGLGALLYLLLTGRAPFQGSTVPALLQAVTSLTPAPPSAHRPGLSPALDALVVDALAKDPARRPALDDLRGRLAALAPR